MALQRLYDVGVVVEIGFVSKLVHRLSVACVSGATCVCYQCIVVGL